MNGLVAHRSLIVAHHCGSRYSGEIGRFELLVLAHATIESLTPNPTTPKNESRQYTKYPIFHKKVLFW
jgi:hypothetical protein